jgi:hypothetical protein
MLIKPLVCLDNMIASYVALLLAKLNIFNNYIICGTNLSYLLVWIRCVILGLYIVAI